MAGAYLKLMDGGELGRRVDAAREMLRSCRVCPHACGVDRLAGEKGKCRTGAGISISSYNDHHGEEPPISGTRGSGTIFFTNCNMACVFCQNYPISQLGNGRPATAQRLADYMLELQERGCHNINWVTPTHAAPQALEALQIAAERGLRLPIVYNCGGYESLEMLRLLDGVVDIYMPDIKYGANAPAEKYSGAKNYFDRACEAVREMHRQVGELTMDAEGVAVRGLLIRHLVLPENISRSDAVFEFIATEISPDTYMSIMDQYFPAHRAMGMPPMNRGVTWEEYQTALDWAEKWGLERGWVQGMLEERT